MRIPHSFKKRIEEAFYDKELVLYTIQTTTDDEGYVAEHLTQVDSFLGNVQYSKLDQVREEYGLKEDIDVTITTNKKVANNSIVSYEDNFYKIVKSVPYDSHNYLIGKKYEQNSVGSSSQSE